MRESTLEQNTFNPQAYIEQLSSELVTLPDANGNAIPAFRDFMQTISTVKNFPIEKLNKDTIDRLKITYHTVIYSRPVPLSGDPFEEEQKILESLLAGSLEEEKNMDMSGFTVDLGDGAKFNPSKGELFDPKNKVSDFRKLELEKYLEFRKNNNF